MGLLRGMLFNNGTPCTDHWFAYTGTTPCTGPEVCIYCGDQRYLPFDQVDVDECRRCLEDPCALNHAGICEPCYQAQQDDRRTTHEA